jgi:hypothetical protein
LQDVCNRLQHEVKHANKSQQHQEQGSMTWTFKERFHPALCNAIALALALTAPAAAKAQPSPEWTSDLIIYEVATRSYTSPAGPQSGNFASLAERLPHLEQLGVNAIWLTGHSLADPKHFYNIWTQYAVIEPDQFDPAVGTPAQFKALVDAAHARGIRVFLDVITHGVMPESSLVKKHPHWFRGGGWGMVDYDWHGGHADLDDWWVKTWTDYVTTYGVDGFRLDVDIYRPDLWARIRRNAEAAGHPIVIMGEHPPLVPGVTDFAQRGNLMSNQLNDDLVGMTLDDVPGFYDTRFPAGRNPYSAEGSRAIFGYSFLFTPMIPLFMGGEEFDANFRPLPELSPDLYSGRMPGRGHWLYGAQLPSLTVKVGRDKVARGGLAVIKIEAIDAASAADGSSKGE